jgi:hypothetical protein
MDGYAAHPFLTVPFDFVLDDECVVALTVAGVEREGFHRLQVHYFLVLADLDLLGLEGIRGGLELLASLEQGNPQFALGEHVAFEDEPQEDQLEVVLKIHYKPNILSRPRNQQPAYPHTRTLHTPAYTHPHPAYPCLSTIYPSPFMNSITS